MFCFLWCFWLDFSFKRVKLTHWVPTSQESETIKKKSKSIKCAGLRGLKNVGSTCFMNVILQTFVHNPPLRAHFLSDRHNHQLCNIKYCMACQMDILFSEVFQVILFLDHFLSLYQVLQWKGITLRTHFISTLHVVITITFSRIFWKRLAWVLYFSIKWNAQQLHW